MSARAWRLVATGYAILAVAFTVVAIILVDHLHETEETQAQIKAQQQRNIAVRDRLAALTQRTTGAVCLLALAPDTAAEHSLVERYIAGEQIPLNLYGPRCPKAIEVTRRALEGETPIPAP